MQYEIVRFMLIGSHLQIVEVNLRVWRDSRKCRSAVQVRPGIDHLDESSSPVHFRPRPNLSSHLCFITLGNDRKLQRVPSIGLAGIPLAGFDGSRLPPSYHYQFVHAAGRIRNHNRWRSGRRQTFLFLLFFTLSSLSSTSARRLVRKIDWADPQVLRCRAYYADFWEWADRFLAMYFSPPVPGTSQRMLPA